MGSDLFTMYEVGVNRLALILSDGTEKTFPEALKNGRANYVIFESLVRDLAGLQDTTGSDHQDAEGKKYEQKSYVDPKLANGSSDLFHCCASSTFGPNNDGPRVKHFLDEGDYESALALCKLKGYSKNDYYIFTNSGHYSTEVPFRYFIIPTQELIENLSSEDPREVSLSKLLAMIQAKVVLV